ncbi:uncharacterized protein LOC124912547 [Impatiens glandulifera]|uniref:uncharacterized protein LOC124912547 n=1 Tax=Impatiens glandulifera TaxID=253017 RepID=UPI001FB0ADD1|nr:uncharacterized protein LOC124912547 [Impatiens glandulifera]
MFKRHDHHLQSSSRRENVPDHRVNAVGCMAGVFQLISKYHRRRKFLTSGSKKRPSEEENNSSSAVKQLKVASDGRKLIKQTEIIKKLPAVDHHRESVVDDDDDDEKGRRLMEGLRKCDEDLRKIQKVLEEARAARSISPERRRLTTFRQRITSCKTPVINNNKYFWHAQQSKEWKLLNKKFIRMMTRDNNVDEQTSILNVAEASISINTGCHGDRNLETTPPPLILLLRWSDKVVKESVEEICKNMRREQKREFTKIGLVLQECIYSDLIEELINFSEFKHVNHRSHVMMKNQLPRHLCKRSLRF